MQPGLAGRQPTMSESERPRAFRCGTCSATFPTQEALLAHLRRAYHGVQCLDCGALLSDLGSFQTHQRALHEDRRMESTRARGA